jgi:hypothetical protein
LFFDFNLLKIFESPEKKYSREMEPVLIKLDEWYQGPVAQWDEVMDTPVDEETTNGDLFAFYIVSKDYPSVFGKDFMESSRTILAPIFVPTAESIVSSGYDVQVSLGGITPPDSIKIAHQQVNDCVKYEVDRANAVVKFLTENDTVLIENLNEASCTLLPSALEKIRGFIRENR